MKSATDTLGALRQGTAALHNALDAVIRSQVTADPKRGVRTFLQGIARVLPPIERSLSEMAWPAQLETPRRLQKTSWLAADLDALPAPWPHQGPWLTDERWGVLYTVEGSMLGVAALRRLAGPSAQSSRYLQGYRDETPQMWRSLLRVLELETQAPEQREAAVRGAVRCFEAFLSAFAQTTTPRTARAR